MNFNIEKYIKKYYILNESSADKKILNLLKSYGIDEYDTRMNYIGYIKEQVSNLRLDSNKFLYAVIRMWHDGELKNASSLEGLNNVLKAIHISGDTKNYNENLNDSSLDKLIPIYSKILKEILDNDIKRSKNKKINGSPKYIICPYNSFYLNIWIQIGGIISDSARLVYYRKHMHDKFDSQGEYGSMEHFKKVEPLLCKIFNSKWCITYDVELLNMYTTSGLRFYICYNEDYLMGCKDLKELCNKLKNENEETIINLILTLIDTDKSPLDLYGLSAIAIEVSKDGSLERVTTRWNHEFNGENPEGLETAELIEDLMNIKFYDTFKPYTADELESLSYTIELQLSLPILGKTYLELVFKNKDKKIGFIFSKKGNNEDDLYHIIEESFCGYYDETKILKEVKGIQLINKNDMELFVNNFPKIPKEFFDQATNMVDTDYFYLFPVLDNNKVDIAVEIIHNNISHFRKLRNNERQSYSNYFFMYKYDYNDINNNIIKNPNGTIYRLILYGTNLIKNPEFKKLNNTYSFKKNVNNFPILYKCDKNDNDDIIGIIYDKTNKTNASCIYIKFLYTYDDFNKTYDFPCMEKLHISYDNGHYETNQFVKPFINDIIDHIKYLINNVFTNIDLNITYINSGDGDVIGPLGSDKIQLMHTYYNFDKEKQYRIGIYYTDRFVIEK